MTDPVFTTRADLDAWLKDRTGQLGACRAIRMHRRVEEVSERIKRVTLAHSHLPYEAINETPAPHFPSSSYASGTNQGCTAEVTSDGGTTGFEERRESASMAVAGGRLTGSPPQLFDHGNSPDSLQWLAHVKAWGWPFRAFDDPREVGK